jgi:NADPH-dependent curcumin reductase CurA
MPHIPHGSHGRVVIVVALIAGSLVLGACGSSEEAPTILNTEKVESAIEQSILNQRGQTADVSCPSGVHQQDALVFTCWATVGSNNTPFVVTQTDASGQVRYEADPR